MSIEWVNRAIDGLRAWGSANSVDVDVDEVRLLCDYASDYLEVNELGDFRPGTFEELLLEIYPRKVIAPPETAPETVAAARTLVEFLVGTGEIATKVAARMRATIDRIGPEMPAALADTSKYGMAKSIFSAIGADSLELGHPLPVQGATAETVRDTATLDEECDCPGCAPLPAVRLAPVAEVVAAAREVPLLRDAHTVTAWLADHGGTTTVRKALRVKDARRITQELGVARPALAWRLALELGLADLAGTAVVKEEAFRVLADRAPEEVLDLWIGTVEFLGEEAREVTGEAAVDNSIYSIHDLLYRVREPVPLDQVADYLREVADGGLVEDLPAALAALSYAGTVRLTPGGLALTEHGQWGLREMYDELGLDAPVAADLAAGDAGALIAGLLQEGLADEAAERDVDRWLDARSPADAAGELLSAVAGAPAQVRGVAVTIVDRLGRDAESSVRGRLGDPELRPHAIHWLSSRGLEAPPLTEAEMLWVTVDMLALAIPAAEADPERFAENMGASGPAPEVIEDLWRVEHPDLVEVLELLGQTLPDETAAKAARKAAFKARSRGIR
ncbi:hypothetical protein Aph01nite_14380 [Acrocarpospora phusangensis]|uniref:Uncharacterized protein n=1 Tax=Acrocarpospora phusangensis TaxID=1070424 RepID=A0A919Q941_9ACTN|nr:hypothetical protein [Acrocarpospora phusangensis]GIH23128.1 hypothetical protein Aph01nite_14380 [Acrocarpospora phusangensis]